MKLSQLIDGIHAEILSGSADSTPTAICCDSRKATRGALFVAVQGTQANGRDFVKDAIDKGASCAIQTDRQGLAVLADRFFDHPSGKLKLVGITGTNGKTTTVTLLYRLFKALGQKCGLLSTIANYVDDERIETDNTTADSITINSLLARMVEEGCEYCFMEVSSIGVEQCRTYGLSFAEGIFSNLTHDHLDYHKTFAEYLRCKKLFFDNLGAESIAIINTDDRNGSVMVQNTKAKVVSYALKRPADHCCRIIEESIEGMLLSIDGVQLWVRLSGEYNAYNILAIYTAALCLGADPTETLVQLSSLAPAPGRMETYRLPDGKTVVIDYAHTPDALENILSTLKKVEPGRQLVCLFGCGGDRDSSKRPEMAAVAERYADKIVVSSDNPRSENEMGIIKDICAGFSPAGRAKAVCIPDREEAIRTALSISQDNAVILLAGKGHETYQITAEGKRHFDEREVLASLYKQD